MRAAWTTNVKVISHLQVKYSGLDTLRIINKRGNGY
jgi:hypothetical protein